MFENRLEFVEGIGFEHGYARRPESGYAFEQG